MQKNLLIAVLATAAAIGVSYGIFGRAEPTKNNAAIYESQRVLELEHEMQGLKAKLRDERQARRAVQKRLDDCLGRKK